MTIPIFFIALFLCALVMTLLYLIRVTDKLAASYKELSKKINEIGVGVTLEYRGKEKAPCGTAMPVESTEK